MNKTVSGSVKTIFFVKQGTSQKKLLPFGINLQRDSFSYLNNGLNSFAEEVKNYKKDKMIFFVEESTLKCLVDLFANKKVFKNFLPGVKKTNFIMV